MTNHKTEGRFRVDVTDDNRTWTSNALRFDTEDEAETYVLDLAWRWTALRGWRVVPSDWPQREAVDYAGDAWLGHRCRNYG